MKALSRGMVLCLAILLTRGVASAQLPVEVFTGHKKVTADIMFFRFFKNKEGKNSRFLFFNRNRASIDYKMTKTTNLPQFGFTEAISYNHERLKGFAPVVVAGILNRGVSPKAGIQFARVKKDLTIFSWLVSETLEDPNIDLFFLGRYTPQLSGKLNLFSQVELFQSFPTVKRNGFSVIQRFRLGLKIKAVQFGAGMDLSQSGRNDWVTTVNTGVFLRYEF